MKTILFVTYGGGHAHMVTPVVHELRKSGGLSIEVLGLPAAQATLRRSGIEPLGFRDYLDEAKDADALAWGRELARKHHSPTIGAELEDSVAYLGLSYKDLVVRLGPEQAEELFRRRARHAFHPLTILERVLDDVRPDFVVTTNSPRAEAAAVEVANRRGLGTLSMTDLFTGLGDNPLRARHLTFLNEVARDMFAADGLADGQRSRFHLTGNPAFDPLLTLPKTKDPGWTRSRFPRAEGRPLVLHADLPAYWDPPSKSSHVKTDAEIQEELQACYDAAMANGAAYLVRPHPSQDRAYFHGWVDRHPGAELAADGDLHELLRNIDLLVARSTTVGLEAAYLRKRILQIGADYHADFPLAKMGVAWGVNSYGELTDELKHALTDDRRHEEIKRATDHLLPAEAAAPKIARIILENL